MHQVLESREKKGQEFLGIKRKRWCWEKPAPPTPGSCDMGRCWCGSVEGEPLEEPVGVGNLSHWVFSTLLYSDQIYRNKKKPTCTCEGKWRCSMVWCRIIKVAWTLLWTSALLMVSNIQSDPCHASTMKHLSSQCAALLKSPMKRLWVTAAAHIPFHRPALLLHPPAVFFFSCIRFHAAEPNGHSSCTDSQHVGALGLPGCCVIVAQIYSVTMGSLYFLW